MDFVVLRKLARLVGRKNIWKASALVMLILVSMFVETLSIGILMPMLAIFTDIGNLDRFPVLLSVLPDSIKYSQSSVIIAMLAGVAIIYLLKNIYLGFLALQITTFCYDLQVDLSKRLFSSYLGQPYEFHLQRDSAQLVRNAILEVGYVTGRVLMPSLRLTAELFVVVGLVTLLMIIEPISALVTSLLFASILFIFRYLTKTRVIRSGEERQLHEGMRIKNLQQGFGAVNVIKLTDTNSFFEAKYDVHNLASARASCWHSCVQQLPALALEVLAVTSLATFVLVLILQGDQITSVLPSVGVFAAVAFRLMPSVNRIILATQSIRHGKPAISLIYSELSHLSPSTASPNAGCCRLVNQVVVENVDYRYPSASGPSISGVSLRIRRGEAIGFIGPSGAGKSTLMHLLLGLLKPTRGTILVDGVDIHANIRSWQANIGYVPQSIYLSDETLVDNIAFGVPKSEVDYKAVARAIEVARLDSFVASLPLGLSTRVGERGVRLSGGQMQRLGLARALYRDPPVIVLDEATSSLDMETEAAVMEAINSLYGRKTIIIVAHRLTTVQKCDRLYRLDDGRISDVFRAARVPQ